MLLSMMLALFFYCMGANSAPLLTCPDAKCGLATQEIICNLNKSKISSWKTRVINETDFNLAKCNLKIFQKEFDHQCTVDCSVSKNLDKPECLLKKGLECLSYNCQIPHTECPDFIRKGKRNFRKILMEFVKTIERNQKEHLNFIY